MTTQQQRDRLMQVESFRQWFTGSRATDHEGLPLLVFRGEHGAPEHGELQTRLGSLTFTDCQGVANTYATRPNDRRMQVHTPRVIEAYLSIRNPIIENRDDPFVDLRDVVSKLGIDLTVAFATKHAARIENTNNWDENFAGEWGGVADLLAERPLAVNELYLDAYALLDDPQFVAEGLKRGFDGAIHVGNGASMDAMEFRVFSPAQVKVVAGPVVRHQRAAPSV